MAPTPAAGPGERLNGNLNAPEVAAMTRINDRIFDAVQASRLECPEPLLKTLWLATRGQFAIPRAHVGAGTLGAPTLRAELAQRVREP